MLDCFGIELFGKVECFGSYCSASKCVHIEARMNLCLISLQMDG